MRTGVTGSAGEPVQHQLSGLSFCKSRQLVHTSRFAAIRWTWGYNIAIGKVVARLQSESFDGFAKLSPKWPAVLARLFASVMT